MEAPIILVNHPKKGVIIEGRSCRHGSIYRTRETDKQTKMWIIWQ